MPEALIFAAAEIIEIVAVDAGIEAGAIAFAEGTTFAGTAFAVSNVTLIQGGLALAASIGLAFALRPALPKPQDGTQGIKESVQPRQRGYGWNRLGGTIVLFEAVYGSGGTAYQINAFHHGQITQVIGVYFDDEPISTTPAITTGGGSVNSPDGTQYAFATINWHAGLPTETPNTLFTADPNINTFWTSAFVGHGVAHFGMVVSAPLNAEDFSNMWPRGLPRPSVVALCSKVWDPRDNSVASSFNPVIQLIDYLTLVDGGCGFPLAEILPPAVLAQWMVEADLVRTVSGSTTRYESHGWYKFDNKPEDVIGHLLSTFDGWMAEDGDGTLVLVAGYYREPTDPALTSDHIKDMLLNFGMADENVVNQLDVSWTDPSYQFAEVQFSVRDEVSIVETGVVRAQALDLTWVQWKLQAERLAKRALLRLNPRRSGTMVTTLYGLRYLGKRWIKLQYPAISDLADCVIEIQGAEADILGGTVTFNWILVDPAALIALQ